MYNLIWVLTVFKPHALHAMQSQTDQCETIGLTDESSQKPTGLPTAVSQFLRRFNEALRYKHTVTESLYNAPKSTD